MSKRKIKIAALCLFGVIAVTACIMFIPRTGKKVSDVWSATDEFDSDSIATVTKQKDKPFRIMLFTDLQLWSDILANNEVFRLTDELVDEVRPDMIITLGDNVSGISTDILTLSFIEKMESYKVPWAPVFGNHDSEGNATLEWQADKFEKADHCLFRRGPSNLYGLGNYAVNVVEDGEVIETLFMFDNGRYYDYGAEGKREIYMGYEQIAWYEWTVNGMAAAEGKTVPSMAFSHFAMPQFRTAVERICYQDENGFYRVPEEYGSGYCKYLPGTAPVDSGFIDVAKRLGSTTHVFCGHDHENNASIAYDGIVYTYGLKTGCSPKPWNDADFYGATVIEIDKDVRVFNVTRDK